LIRNICRLRSGLDLDNDEVGRVLESIVNIVVIYDDGYREYTADHINRELTVYVNRLYYWTGGVSGKVLNHYILRNNSIREYIIEEINPRTSGLWIQYLDIEKFPEHSKKTIDNLVKTVYDIIGKVSVDLSTGTFTDIRKYL
jgi:hypothetical protein